MEKFGMSFGGGPSKKDLMDTIESQRKQLVQYQTRFKDVVRAYKSLLKEKEALEASLKVLTVSQEVDLGQQYCGTNDDDNGSVNGAGTASVTSDLPDDGGSLHSEDSLDTAAFADMATAGDSPGGERGAEENGGTPAEAGADPNGSESGVGSSSSSGSPPAPFPPLPPPPVAAEAMDRRILQLRSQLATLTSSLATVSQEKSRMEASFQADKRGLKQELEEMQGRLDEARRQHEAELLALQEQLAESKARVITQQHERAQEQGDHALMLRELQRLLQTERDLRRDAELRLEDTAAALQDARQEAERGTELAARLREAAEEREELRRGLRAAEAERARPDPRLEELRQELAEVKGHYQQQLQQESRRAAVAEERARQQAGAEEGRVASLEERVSELSALLGACEMARQRDQLGAQRMRERLLQLDAENKTLAIAATTSSISISSMTSSSGRAPADPGLGEDEEQWARLDVNVLRDKMERLKKLLLEASPGGQEQGEVQEDIGVEGGGGGSSDGEKASTLYYQQELRQLKEEFERYKQRAQAALKGKGARDVVKQEEVHKQLAELKEKYVGLRVDGDRAEAERRRVQEEARRAATALLQEHRQERERLEAQHRDGLQRLEGELHRQRDRAMALLAEKDQELEQLRAAVAAAATPPPVAGRGERDLLQPSDNDDGTGVPAAAEGEGVAQALRLAGGPQEPALLLYAEQLARAGVEVDALRRQRRRLEEDTRRLHGELAAAEERRVEEAAALGARLDELRRERGREGANMEYLKNVLLKFLTMPDDGGGRRQTLAAVLAVLHCSPQETQRVLRMHTHTWWQGGRR